MKLLINRKVFEHAIANMMSDAQRRAMFAQRTKPKTVTSKKKAVAAPKPSTMPKRIPYGDDAIGGIRPKPASPEPQYRPSSGAQQNIRLRTTGKTSYKNYKNTIARAREILRLF